MCRVVCRSWLLSPRDTEAEGNGALVAVNGGEREVGSVCEVEGRELGSA